MNEFEKKSIGQGSEIKKTEVSFSLEKVSIFSSDPYFLFVFKKTQKIATALYMITDFFSDSEPIKWSIRDKAVRLLDGNMSLNTKNSPDRKALLDSIIQNSLGLISLCEVGYFSGIISSMNFSIIKKEFENLIQTIENREMPTKLGRNFAIPEAFLDEQFLTSAAPLVSSTNSAVSSAVNTASNSSSHIKDNRKDIGHSIKDKVQAPANKPFKKHDNKDSRKDMILSIIKKKGDSSIKDIAQGIHGCSEKTIQRELIAMVSEGVLKKEGERRWSRYAVAN